MRHHYNLIANDSGPVIRDCPVYDASSITKGEILTYGADERGGVLISGAPTTCADIVGVAAETKVASTTVITSGTLVYAKVILNPDAIYLTQWDPTADCATASATTAAITTAACDDDLDGSWVYLNDGTGIGQLGYVGAADTTVLTLDTTTAFGVRPDSTTTFLLIRRPWKRANSTLQDLDSTGVMLKSALSGGGGYNLILENYIEATTIPFGPLRPRQHHALAGLNNASVKFYSDLYLIDNILLGTPTNT